MSSLPGVSDQDARLRQVRAAVLGAVAGPFFALYLPIHSEAIGVLVFVFIPVGACMALAGAQVGRRSGQLAGIAGGMISGGRFVGGLVGFASLLIAVSSAPALATCLASIGLTALAVLLGVVAGAVGACSVGQRQADSPVDRKALLWLVVAMLTASPLAVVGAVASIREHRREAGLAARRERDEREISRALFHCGFTFPHVPPTLDRDGFQVECADGVLSLDVASMVVASREIEGLILRQRDSAPLSGKVVDVLTEGGFAVIPTEELFGEGTVKIARVRRRAEKQ